MHLISFKVNGRTVNVREGTNLLKYLREEERLTSVKNGCDSGVCGSCTVLVDGKAVRSCTLKVDKLQGREVLTVEGLDVSEKEVYSNAFAEAGAVPVSYTHLRAHETVLDLVCRLLLEKKKKKKTK